MAWTDILEILKYTIPALIVFLTSYLIIRSYISGEIEKKNLEVRMNNYKEALPIRLQAYERLTLFLERVTPVSMIQRVNKQGMNSRDLQMALLANIRLEFEHNLAQQIYVSSEAWILINEVKDEISAVINRVAASLPEHASGKDLSRGVFEFYINNEQAMPTQKALDKLKAEVRKIF